MKPTFRDSRFSQLLIEIHSSLWFAPVLVVAVLAALALGLVEFDRHADDLLRSRWPRIFAVEAEGARSILSTIAGAMATVSGVAFSITIVALALASNQYTSRVMRNFMRDRANQVVLGIFIGVFIYCLLVLRTISGQEGAFIPAAAVCGALLLAIVASGAFIYFVHHISATIQASDMAEAIARETLAALDDTFPGRASDGGGTGAEVPHAASAWHPVPALRWGYIQTVAQDRLYAFACRHGIVVRLECMAGDFVAPGQALVSLAMAGAPERPMVAELNRAFGIGAYRTIDQDPAFGIRQLVDMAIKALSPAINDTTTAVTCLEHIGVVLQHCTGRDLAARRYHDGQALRLVTRTCDFAHFVGLAFGQVIDNAEGNTVVMLKVFGTIGRVARCAATPQEREALRRQLDTAAEVALRGATSNAAGADLRQALAEARGALAEGVCAPPAGLRAGA